MAIAPPIDREWYDAVTEVQQLTNSKKDTNIKNYIKKREAQIESLEMTIKLYQQNIAKIHGLAAFCQSVTFNTFE